MCKFPAYIINEIGDKLIPNTGNLLFLESCIYTSPNFPVRLLIDEGKDNLTCAFVVYITTTDFICIDTSSVGKDFQSLFKIPIDTFENLCYNGFSYKIYIKEVLTH